jgi:DNA-directed RNA polymerase subunit RPC12/RpoP
VSEWWLGFCVGASSAWFVALVIDRYFVRKYDALIDEAFVRGADLSVKNHADSMRREKRLDVHGFAVRCPECSQVFTALQCVRAEYVKCPTCNHRIPAPLASQKEVAR